MTINADGYLKKLIKWQRWNNQTYDSDWLNSESINYSHRCEKINENLHLFILDADFRDDSFLINTGKPDESFNWLIDLEISSLTKLTDAENTAMESSHSPLPSIFIQAEVLT